MPAQLNLGDRVRLRGGGPLMTVHSINGDNIDCQWFTVQGELQAATFPLYMLTIIEGAAEDAQGRRKGKKSAVD